MSQLILERLLRHFFVFGNQNFGEFRQLGPAPQALTVESQQFVLSNAGLS